MKQSINIWTDYGQMVIMHIIRRWNGSTPKRAEGKWHEHETGTYRKTLAYRQKCFQVWAIVLSFGSNFDDISIFMTYVIHI